MFCGIARNHCQNFTVHSGNDIPYGLESTENTTLVVFSARAIGRLEIRLKITMLAIVRIDVLE